MVAVLWEQSLDFVEFWSWNRAEEEGAEPRGARGKNHPPVCSVLAQVG